MTTIEIVNGKIARVAEAERITKPLLSELSREILEVVLINSGKEVAEGEAVKGTEDSRTINELLDVLTPVNKRACILFFKHFAPFMIATNEAGEFQSFGKKNKKAWEEKVKDVEDFLNDPHNNIWTWSDRNIEMEQKPFDVKKVTKVIESALKKANKGDVIRAIMAGGLELADILAVLEPEQE